MTTKYDAYKFHSSDESKVLKDFQEHLEDAIPIEGIAHIPERWAEFIMIGLSRRTTDNFDLFLDIMDYIVVAKKEFGEDCIKQGQENAFTFLSSHERIISRKTIMDLIIRNLSYLSLFRRENDDGKLKDNHQTYYGQTLTTLACFIVWFDLCTMNVCGTVYDQFEEPAIIKERYNA